MATTAWISYFLELSGAENAHVDVIILIRRGIIAGKNLTNIEFKTAEDYSHKIHTFREFYKKKQRIKHHFNVS